MTSVKVDIDIGAIVEGVKEASKLGLRAVAEEVAARARASSAFTDKTGELRKSITVETPDARSPVVLVKAKAPHAHLIEFGHAKVTPGGRVVGFTPAHPFLTPAAEEVFQRAEEIAAAAMAPVNIEVG